MAVFRRQRRTPRPAGAGAECFAQVGRGAQLRGQIHGAGILLVHGDLQGVVEIRGDLIVGQKGRLTRVRAKASRVRVEGQAEGWFRVDGPLEVARGAVLFGEVEARQIQTSAGCTFAGALRVAHARRS